MEEKVEKTLRNTRMVFTSLIFQKDKKRYFEKKNLMLMVNYCTQKKLDFTDNHTSQKITWERRNYTYTKGEIPCLLATYWGICDLASEVRLPVTAPH